MAVVFPENPQQIFTRVLLIGRIHSLLLSAGMTPVPREKKKRFPVDDNHLSELAVKPMMALKEKQQDSFSNDFEWDSDVGNNNQEQSESTKLLPNDNENLTRETDDAERWHTGHMGRSARGQRSASSSPRIRVKMRDTCKVETKVEHNLGWRLLLYLNWWILISFCVIYWFWLPTHDLFCVVSWWSWGETQHFVKTNWHNIWILHRSCSFCIIDHWMHSFIVSMEMTVLPSLLFFFFCCSFPCAIISCCHLLLLRCTYNWNEIQNVKVWNSVLLTLSLSCSGC